MITENNKYNEKKIVTRLNVIRSTNTSKNTYSIKMIKRSQNSVYASIKHL